MWITSPERSIKVCLSFGNNFRSLWIKLTNQKQLHAKVASRLPLLGVKLGMGTKMSESKSAARAVPSWVPIDVRNYVFHTEMGQPIRVLARSQACHASTIMRQIRKIEQRRDDPLVDRAIKTIAKDGPEATIPTPLEMMQALRRLAMPDAMLAIAIGMEQGVIVQDRASAEQDHGTKLPSDMAMAFALRGWISTSATTGRVLRYRITPAGRVALRELTAEAENQARALAEAPAGYDGAPTGVGTWASGRNGAPVTARMPSQESPVVALSRRKDRDGKPVLTRAMVRAAERLREDFELAHVGRTEASTTPIDWDAMLQAIDSHKVFAAEGNPASVQVGKALTFLGPGLSEVALRCCCLLEGLEITEKQMGWAARSGKVVLRIALQRLVLYYEENGELGPLIG